MNEISSLIFVGISCILGIPVAGRLVTLEIQHNGQGQGSLCDLPDDLHLTIDDRKTSAIIAIRRVQDFKGFLNWKRELREQPGSLEERYEDNPGTSSVTIKCFLPTGRVPTYQVNGFVTIHDHIYLLKPSQYPSYNKEDNHRSFHVLHPLSDTDNPFSQKVLHFAETYKQRRKRATVPQYTIDIYVIVDYKFYEHWYRLSVGATPDVKKSNTKNDIARYIALIFKGVAASSPWTSNFDVNGQVNANSSLWSLRRYIPTAGIPPNDHVMLFTGYDIVSLDTGVLFKYTTGEAFVGTMCDQGGASVSIIEDHAAFQSVHTTAHELAHSLGATHDGPSKACKATDRYIMAGGPHEATPQTRSNPWLFSPCSIQEMGDFLQQTIKTQQGANCVNQGSATSPAYPDVENLYPGQIYSPDDQCRHFYGDASHYCRGSVFGTVDQICYSMFCRNSTDTSKISCIELHAADQTSCGDKKWCSGGKCVVASAAPAKDERCVHGDEPGLVINSKTCVDLVKDSPAFCYEEDTRLFCCDSCKKVKRNVEGCEYGDKVRGCSAAVCKSISSNGIVDDDQCCGTCNFNPSQWTCRDDTTPGLDCSRVQTYDCYNRTIAFHCCATCETARDKSKKDCEYGDRTSGCSGISNNGKLCPSSEPVKFTCCATCSSNLQATDNGSPSVFQSSIALTAIITLQLQFIYLEW